MTIERLHQEIKFRWNKINSNHKKDFPAAYLDDAINKVTQDYIEIFYSGNNSKEYKFGFEVTQQRIDMLQTLVARDLTTGGMLSYPAVLITTDEYKVDLSSFDPKYRHFLRANVIPLECTSKVIPVTITRLNDLDTKLQDSNTQPSLTWRRCLGSIKNNNIVLYTKNYSIDSVKIEYLREPVKVFSGGYNSLEFLNGDTSAYQALSSTVTSDLPEQYHDLLADMVVQYMSVVLEDSNKFQLQEKQVLNKV